MNHHEIESEEGSFAGSWWQEGSMHSFCTWTYDCDTRRLYVRRGPLGRERTIHHSKIPTSDEELLLKLRDLALIEAKRLPL
jgi:hypothetical protein